MSKSEIFAELPRVSAQERADVLARLWDLEESTAPTALEKAFLNEAQADYDANPAAGAPWREV